jgi:hypothetical protein
MLVITISGVSFSQDRYPAIGTVTYKAAIEDEFTKFGASRYLYEHADAYQRLVQFHALNKMGYDLMTPQSELQDETETLFNDTTVDVSKKGSSDQEETTIAISRLNPNIIVAGANDVPGMISSGMPAYYTTDGGKNWAVARVPKLNSSSETLGDPAIVAGDSGYFYYAYLAAGSSSNEDNLVVASSKDGRIWKNGGYIVPQDEIAGFEDKENICVDNSPTSPYYGRVYVAWAHFNGFSAAEGGIGKIAWSDDRGKTWSPIVDFIDSLIMFTEIRLGNKGEILLSFSIPDDDRAQGKHFFLVSSDGGKTFQKRVIANFMQYPLRSQDSRPSLKGDYGFRAFPYIAHDIDLKSNLIHLVYGSWYNDTIHTPAASLYYISSHDLGKTWTKPLAVGISNPQFNTLDHDRFSPWVSVNQKTGDAYCSYYSSERDTNNELISAYRTKLTGGLKEYPHPLEDSDFDPTLITKTQGIAFIGDYQGSDSYDSVFASSWTEGKGDNDGDVFVFIQSPNHPAGSTGVPVVIHSSNIWLSAPFPNPVSANDISFSYYLPNDAIAEIALYSIAGEKVKTFVAQRSETGTHSEKYPLEGLNSGTYILRVSTPYGSAERNIVVVK